MTTNERLTALTARCRASVTVSMNPHRDYYETPEVYIKGRDGEVSSDELSEMVRTDTLIELQFYPDTPIGFFLLFGLDLDALLDEALEILDNEAARVFQ